MGKDVQFVFRVESPLRDKFVRMCKELDRPAGQVLREFMRGFVKDNVQASLFDETIPFQDQSPTVTTREKQ